MKLKLLRKSRFPFSNPDKRIPNTYDELYKHLRRDLSRYFSGEKVEFDYPVDLSSLPPFSIRVLKKAREIHYGEKRTYSWLARKLGGKNLSRAVGQALRKNPIPIIIPCHRVINADGTIGGYSSGSELKKQLLNMESKSSLKK